MFKIISKLSLILLFFIFQIDITAQDGQVDINFNSTDNGSQELTQFASGYAKNAIVYPDGSMIVVGDFKFFNGIQRNGIIKLNSDLSESQNFQVGTGADSTILGIRLLQNGKIFLFGKFTFFNNTLTNGTVLLLNDGSIDPNYQPNQSDWLIAEGSVTDAIEQNGKIVISGGISNNLSGNAASKIQRISLDGQRDLTMSDFGEFNSVIFDLELGQNDSIYAGGAFNQCYGDEYHGIVKLSPNGAIDTTYKVTLPSVTYNPIVQQIDLDDSNRIVYCLLMNGVYRLSRNGELDTSFNTYANGNIGVKADSIHKYLMVCNIQIGIKLIYRVNLDGSRDTGFKDFKYVGNLDQSIQQVIIRSDSKIIVLGGSQIYVLNPNGTRDAGFNPQKGVRGKVTAVKVLEDGKIIIGGSFYGYNEHSIQNIARLTSDGELDILFNPNLGVYKSVFDDIQITKIDVQTDGKIILIGNFIRFNETIVNKIIRLNPNGSLDTTFAPNTVFGFFSSEINDFLILPDGKLLLCSNQGVRRFNSDGSFDPSFFYPPILGNITKLLPLENGKFLVGGDFSNYNGENVKNFIRLNSDGTVDNSFSSGTGLHYGMVWDLGIQSDGKIIVSGNYTIYNGIAVNSVFRIESNGNLDTTFNTSSFFTSATGSFLDGKMKVLPNNKILVNHQFQNEISRRLCRLNSDGSVDSNFELSPNGNINGFGLQSTWGIIAVGDFTSYANVSKNGIVRIHQEEIPQVCWEFTGEFMDIENITCDLDSTYVIYKAKNGNSPYLYSWNNENWSENDTIFRTNQTGIHTISIKDLNGCTHSSNFFIQGPTSHSQTDLTCNLLTDNFRTGFSTITTIDVRNLGCIPTNAQVKLIFDSLLTIVSVNPTPDLVSGDTLTWNIFLDSYNSNPFNPTVEFLTSISAQIGNTINLDISVNSMVTDFDTTNNMKNYLLPVLNGYDPNDKKVYPIGECIPGYIENDQKLTYTIRFQNTGNSEAINIFILDTISANLDLNSLYVIGTSHNMSTELIANRVIKFNFNNINLPDSTTNQEASKGFVIYTLSPTPNLLINTEIKNKAEIYFDFNPEIVTNSVLNTIKYGNSNTLTHYMEVTALDSFNWNGFTYNSTGIYTQHFNALNACDSIVTLDLKIIPSNNSVICSNFQIDSLIFHNKTCMNNAMLTVSVSGGTQPYYYQWDNLVPMINDSSFSTSNSGITNLHVFDVNGCNFSKNYLINNPITSNQPDFEANVVSSINENENQIYSLFLTAQNNSCIPADGTLTFVLDETITFLSAEPAPHQVIGDTLIWNLTNLSFDSNTFTSIINFELDTTTTDQVVISTSILPLFSDLDILNNSRKYIFTIPSTNTDFEKNVYPQGNCLYGYTSDSIFTYGLRIKNELDYDFENGVIIDTISENLDISKLELKYVSKSLHTEIEFPSTIKFHFNEKLFINEVNHLVYLLKTKENIQENSEIQNNTQFYDNQFQLESNDILNTFTNNIPDQEIDTVFVTAYNEYYWNNELLTESGYYTKWYTNSFGCDSVIVLNLIIESNLDLNETIKSTLRVFPNPSSGTLTINGDFEINSITLYSTLGETFLFLKELNSNTFDVGYLADGIYILEIRTNGKDFLEKILIHKKY